MAAGTVLRGFLVSPAAMPTSSVPWYENPAWINTDQKPINFARAPLDLEIGSKRARGSPGVKSKIPFLTGSSVDADSKDHKANDGEDFDS